MNFHRSFPLLPLLLAATLVAAFPSLASAVGSAAGRVTALPDGTPLEGRSVTIYNAAHEWVNATETAADGSWLFEGLPAGDYLLEVVDWDTDYIRAWWDGTPSGSPWEENAVAFAVADDQLRGGLDLALVEGGSISGRVVRRSDGAPVGPGLLVTTDDGSGNHYFWSETDAAGAYTIHGLPDGGWYVWVCWQLEELDLVCQFWDHQSLSWNASPVPVAGAAKVVGVDFDLVSGAKVRGKVVSAVDGSPVAGTYFNVYPVDSNGGYYDTITDGNGEAEIRGITAATYYASASSGSGYVGDYWKDENGETIHFPLAEGEVKEGIVLRLQPGGSVSGRVLDAAGNPVPEAEVELLGLNGEWLGYSAATAADGSYTLDSAPAGDWLAWAHEWDHVAQFYDQAIFGANATPVRVVANETTTGIDFRLAPSGRISGRVVDAATGAPAAGVEMVAFFSEDLWMPAAWTETAADGTYSIPSVIPGQRVYVFANEWRGRWASRWYRDSYFFATATPVAVRPNETTSGIDFALEAPGAMGLAPASFSFTAETWAESVPTQLLTVSNAGPGPVAFYAWTEVDWLSLELDGVETRLEAGESLQIPVIASTWGLGAGTYATSIIVWDELAGVERRIPVTFTLTAAPPRLEFYTDEMWFDAEVGGPDPADDSIWVANLGDGAVDFLAVASVPWITVSPASGRLVHGDEATPLAVSVSTGALAEGEYTATITLTTSLGVKSVAVTVNVAPPAEGDPNAVLPQGIFIYVPGGQPGGKARPHASTTFEISNDGTGTLYWNARFRSDWITLSPDSGALPAGAPPTTVTVTVDPSQLAEGTNSTYFDITSSRVSASVAVQVDIGREVTSGRVDLADGRPLVVPVLVHAPGAFGSQFVSDFWLSHLPNGRDVEATLSFVPDGKDGTVEAYQGTITLGSGQTVPLLDFVRTALGVESGKGSLVIQSPAIVELSAFSRTYNAGTQGTFGQEVPAVPTQEGTSRLEGKVYALGLETSGDFRSNLLLTEVSGWPVTAKVTLVGANGAVLGSRSWPVPPFGTTQVNNVFNAVGFSGEAVAARAEVEVEAGDGRIVVIGSVVDNATNDPTTLFGPQKSSTTRTLVVPVVARTPGVGGTQWVSDVAIANVDSVRRRVTLRFLSPDGLELGIKVLDLPPGTAENYRDIVSGLFQMSQGRGSLRIDVDPAGGVAVQSRTYNRGGGGTYGQGIPGIPAAASIGAGPALLTLVGLENSRRYRANIGVTEVTGQAARVGIALVNAGGDQLLGYREVDLPAGGQFQKNLFGMMGLGEDSIFSAQAIVRVVSGGGRIQAYASSVDNNTGDATTVLPPSRVEIR